MLGYIGDKGEFVLDELVLSPGTQVFVLEAGSTSQKAVGDADQNQNQTRRKY